MQRNDDKMQTDLYHLKSLLDDDGKLIQELKLIKRNHDNLVNKTLESERENEIRLSEANQRVSRAESELAAKHKSQNEIIKRMGMTMERLENDLHV